MILIVGNSVDGVPSVIEEIKKISDKKIIFFKADKCLENDTINFTYINGCADLFFDISGQTIGTDDVTAVWYWKPLLPKALRTIQPPEHQTFIYRQFLAMWRSLVGFLSDRVWVNDYYKLLEAEHKPYQIKVATEIGLNVPDTTVTSNPERAVEFWEHCKKQMIIKALMLSPTENSMIFTNKVTEELMSKISRIKSSPVILQKLIPRKYELRITVVGEEIFPALVESESNLDWRRKKIKLRPHQLPKNVEEDCFSLVKKLGLKYGCIDMIVTPDDQYIFLEINPNGQWFFVECQTGMQIGKAIAHLLV